MPQYLAKPAGSIWFNPLGIYDLKKDLLLYDQLAILNLNELLSGLYEYAKYPVFHAVIAELEYLIKEGLLIELTDLMMPFAEKGSALLSIEDQELGDLTMKLLHQRSEAKSDKQRDYLFFRHSELNTRLFCNITNTNNEQVHVVPSLSGFGTFEVKDSAKSKAYAIINKLIPLPTNDTPWEKILDFKSDNESMLKLLALRNWINDLPENIKANELEEKIRYLLIQYTESLNRHNLQTQLSTFKTVVNAVPTAISEILRFRLDKALDAFFNIAEQQVNFNKYKDRSDLNGKELAYILHTEQVFKKKKK